MQKDECTEPSLFLAYNGDSTQIPTDLLYTSFLILKPKGMFADFLEGDKYVIACGTFEGAILIIGEKPSDNENNNPSLRRISLLCAHEHPVCSMIQTLQDTTFLSISTDGTICCWSLLDFTCIFKKKIFYEKGDYKFILSWSFQNKVWILSTGFFFGLFDLRLQSVVRKIKIPGILSLCLLSPTKLNYVKEFMAVVLAIDKLCVFKIQIKNFLFFLLSESNFSITKPHYKFFLNEYGIIRVDTKTNNWGIMNAVTFKEVLSSHLDLQEDDSISDVEWKSLETMVFSTFKGDFFIVQVHLNERKNKNNETKFKYLIKSTQKIQTNFYCNKFIFNETFNFTEKVLIAFSPDSRKVVLLKQNDETGVNYSTLVLKAKKDQILTFPIESHHPFFLYRKSSKTVILFNSKDNTVIDQFEFDQKVTSVYFGNAKKSGEMVIVVGHSNGSLTFFSQTTRRKVNLEVLSGEVIGITHLPMKHDGHNVILAFSDDSACLIQKEEVLTIFPLNQFKIISILIIQNYILFEHINGLIEGFSVNSPTEPLYLNSIPKKARLIWKYFNNDSTIQNFSNYSSSSSSISTSEENVFLPISSAGERIGSSVILKRVGRSSFCYQFYNVSSMLRNFSSDQIAVMLNYVKTICKLKATANRSYVLIGSDNNSQTFFYPGFAAHSGNIIHASDQITASHFLIKVMLRIVFKLQVDSDQELHKDYVRCLPLFIKFLTLTENLLIKKFLSSVCIDLSSLLTFVKCQNLTESLTIDNEKFLDESVSTFLSLSFVAAMHPECVKSELMLPLLHFLMKLSEGETVESELALFLLIDGKSNAWLKYFNESSQIEKQFYHKIILSICKNRKMNFLLTKFCTDVFNDMRAYCDTLTEIASHDMTCDMKNVINMFWIAATSSNSRAQNESADPMDILITLANLWNVQKTAEFVDSIISQSSLFLNVSHLNNVCVIGKNNGVIFAFSKGKKCASDRPFTSKISLVSLSPNATFCVAVSDEERGACTYQIKTNSLLKKISLSVVEKTALENRVTAVNWTSEEKWCPA